MKKLIFFLLLNISSFTSFACDVCGAYMGIIPNERMSFIGVSYRYRSFSGDAFGGNQQFPSESLRVMHSNSPSNEPTENFELYRTIDLRGRFFLHPKLQVDFILPYSRNSEGNTISENTISGMGDFSIFTAWEVFSRMDGLNYRDRFQVGGGFKLATGDFKNEIEGERADALLQTGTGTNDFFGLIQYSSSYKGFGLFMNTTYKVNSTNSYNERIGNSLNSFLSFFYRIDVNSNLKILPNIQSSYEYTNGLYINSTLENGTSMNVLMSGVGVDMLYKTIGLNIGAQLPVYEVRVVNEIESRLRCMVNLTWNFNQSKFPLLKL
jgi:hypothetical protein